MPSLRTLLVLGRVSNLPTVWSNCIAGWWLGGGGHYEKLPYLLIGATLMYIGGMYLNDAFDAEFDEEFRKERPIPSRAVTLRFVWRTGVILLLGGKARLFKAGLWVGVMGAVLGLLILLYDAIHKAVSFAPVIMGACRCALYFAAGLTGEMGATVPTGVDRVIAESLDWNPGYVAWAGVVLGIYIVGVSFVARRESGQSRPPFWPVLLLAAPIVMALLINTGRYRETAALLALIPGLWILRSLRSAYFNVMPNIGKTVSALLAGIVFIDWLAVANAPREMGAVFIGLFLAALVAQRYVPAT